VAVPTLGDVVTLSFYRWEVRGRGWDTAPYPVSLEPPYRPCFLVPGLGYASEPIDDGKRPTILSSLIESVRSAFASEPPKEEQPTFEERAPFEAPERGRLVSLRLHVPPTFDAKPALTRELLLALGTATHPVSLEIVGTADHASLQVTVDEDDAPLVLAHLRGYASGVSWIEDADLLQGIGSEDTTEVIEFGLKDEFFLPLRALDDFAIDPYVLLIAALEQTRAGESLALQVLYTRTHNPWGRAIHDALDDGDGGCLIEDAPWFLRAAEKKTDSPILAVSVRLVASAANRFRTRELMLGTHAFFRQFGHPGGNELVPLEADAECDLREAVLERTSFRTGMLLSADELTSLAHIPGASVSSEALTRSRIATREAPPVARGHALVLGTNEHRGVRTPVSLTQESRFSHTWLIGATGTGKSTVLAQMIVSDIDAGHGVAVFDPHGDLIDDVLARVPVSRTDDVILVDPADTERPVAFNVLRAESEVEKTLVSSDLVSILRRFATSWGDSMTTVLSESVAALLSHPQGGTLGDVKRFVVDQGFRKGVLTEVPDPDIRRFWEVEYPRIGERSVGPLLSRLDQFLRMKLMRNVLDQGDAKLDVSRVMKEGRILLCRLSKGQIGAENAHLLGSLLLAKVSEVALMRQGERKEDRRPFFVYVDECHHFVSPSLESLLTETRKYNVGLTLAHQTLAQLDASPSLESALCACAHTRIAFRVGDEDAKKVAGGFAHFDDDTLLSLGRGEAIVRIGSATSDCNLATTPLPPAPDDGRVEAIRDASRLRYGTVPTLPSIEPSPPPPVPAPPVPAKVETPRPEPPVRTRPAPPPRSPGRGGERHKYLQHLVKRLAEERGFRATLEAPAGDGQVDVLLERDQLKIGVEISVSTDGAHEAENLRKCVAAGFTHVVCLVSEKKVRTHLAEIAASEFSERAVLVAEPENAVAVLESLGTPAPTQETVVRGYKVKVSRQALSPLDAGAKRAALAALVAKTMKR
jgi:hypothetical protein